MAQIPDTTTYIDGMDGIHSVSKVITGAWNDITENWKNVHVHLHEMKRFLRPQYFLPVN